MNEEGAAHPVAPFARPQYSVEEMLRAKETPPIRSVDDLAADTFETDDELEEFLRFTRHERRRDIA